MVAPQGRYGSTLTGALYRVLVIAQTRLILQVELLRI